MKYLEYIRLVLAGAIFGSALLGIIDTNVQELGAWIGGAITALCLPALSRIV